MTTNKILTEIRQTRGDLARETGYDLNRLFDYVQQCEREAAARGVRSAPTGAGVHPALRAGVREEPAAK